MDVPQTVLNSSDLQAFLDANQIPGELVHCPAPTPTVESAAQVMGVLTDQIVKSILFLVAHRPVLVVACGTGIIDRKPIADRFQVGRKQVKLADAESVVRITGYPAGTVPPFGHRQPLTTILDPRVLAQPFVYAGGGEENALVRLDPAEIRRAAQGEVLAVLSLREEPGEDKLP